MDFKAIASKRVAGIPVLYLGVAAVIVLGVYAWQMKAAPTVEETVEENTPQEGDDTSAPDYAGLVPSGTVTVVQPAPTETEVVKQTNDDWLRAAVSYLMSEKKVTAGEAQAAITNYLEGNDMTFEQGALRDAAITKLGLPPERVSSLGNVGTKSEAPAQRQFSAFPGRHTVKGGNDNSAAKIATLYYGNSGVDYVNKIVAANHKFGTGTGYNVGTVIYVPKWVTPRYFTVTASTRNPGAVAKKNAIPYDEIIALNPGKVAPYAIGTRIRLS